MGDTTAALVGRHDARALAALLRDTPVVALDTEFHTERRYWPELLLVQLHLPGQGVFLVDPLEPEVLPTVAEALGAVPAWIVHGGRQDLRLMQRALGRVPDRVLDTQIAAGLVEPMGRSGLDALLGRFLGRPLCKAQRMADWSRRPLPAEQLTYAASDVRWLPELWTVLDEEAGALGRRDAVEAACGEARHEALVDDATTEAFLHAARDVDLDEAEARALWALVAWRDEVAAREDRPPAFVLGDATLRELARSRPERVEDLARHRRLGERTVQRHGRALVRALSQASDAPPLPPRVRPGTPSARRLLWLEAYAAELGAEGRFAGSLVLPRPSLESLATVVPCAREAVFRALGPWRDRLVGDDLAAALSGEVALALAPDDEGLRRVSRIRDKGDVS